MPKTKISEFSATPANNTDIDSINIAEGCAPSGINDAIRELMSQLKDFQTGAQGDSFGGPISGAVNATVGATTPNTGAFTTLTTTGNVGVGGSPSSWDSAYKVVEFTGGSVLSQNNTQTNLTQNAYISGGNWVYKYTNLAGVYRIQQGVHSWDVAASGTGGTNISFTTAMTLTSGGKLGIGQTGPNATLHVEGSRTTDGSLSFNQQMTEGTAYNVNPMTGVMCSLKYTSGGGYAGMGGWSIGKENTTDGNYSSYFAIHTRFNGAAITEKARITSTGELLVAATTGGSGKLRVSGGGDAFIASYSSPSAGYFFSSNSADAPCVEIFQGRFNKAGLTMSANNTGTVTQIDFFQTGSSRGSISTNNSTTAYNTSSDYRLKENIQPMTGALVKVAALKPCTYKWKADGSDGEGFIAHELAEVVPDCVTGEKDGIETYTDEDGNEQTRPRYQGIDTSFLVATLTAAIQEQQAIIESLKARLDAANL